MAKIPFRSVDDYIAAQADEVQAALHRVRATILKALPDAEELISYNIPAYKQYGRVVIYFAGWKQHYGLYGPNASTAAAFAEGDEILLVRREGHVFRAISSDRPPFSNWIAR